MVSDSLHSALLHLAFKRRRHSSYWFIEQTSVECPRWLREACCSEPWGEGQLQAGCCLAGVQAEHGQQKHIQALLQSKKSKPSGAGQNPPGSRARGGISDKVTRTSLDSEMRFEPEDGGLTGSSWSNPSSVHPLRLWVLWTWWHPKVDAYAPPSVPAGGAKCHLSPTSRYFLWQESNRQFTFYIL